jgi:AraC-like DNA-binding protein
MLLEEELVRRLRVIDGLDLVRQMSSAVAATGGTVPISDIGVAARASSTYLAKRFKAVVGVTPKRLARSYRFTSTVLALDVAWTTPSSAPTTTRVETNPEVRKNQLVRQLRELGYSIELS